MASRFQQKLMHVGDYLAEVLIEVYESDDPWSPTISPEESAKLDHVQVALRRGDVAEASKLAKVYRLTPVSAA
jgi:hypothetical protein